MCLLWKSSSRSSSSLSAAATAAGCLAGSSDRADSASLCNSNKPCGHAAERDKHTGYVASAACRLKRTLLTVVRYDFADWLSSRLNIQLSMTCTLTFCPLSLGYVAARYDFADWLSSRVNMQLSNEAGQSQVMGDIDIKGKDWNGQVKLGTPQFLGEQLGCASISIFAFHLFVLLVGP
jgi:hypothetical protein